MSLFLNLRHLLRKNGLLIHPYVNFPDPWLDETKCIADRAQVAMAIQHRVVSAYVQVRKSTKDMWRISGRSTFLESNLQQICELQSIIARERRFWMPSCRVICNSLPCRQILRVLRSLVENFLPVGRAEFLKVEDDQIAESVGTWFFRKLHEGREIFLVPFWPNENLRAEPQRAVCFVGFPPPDLLRYQNSISIMEGQESTGRVRKLGLKIHKKQEN